MAGEMSFDADNFNQVNERCPGTLGSKPWWMGDGQYDPCQCKLPAGHDGEHACEHTDASLTSNEEL